MYQWRSSTRPTYGSAMQRCWVVVVTASAAMVAGVRAPRADPAPADAAGGAIVVVGAREDQGPVDPGRAASTVDRDDLDTWQPRSAPDALRHALGVTVQQSAAGQGSVYIRGRTGQQTLLLFDGLRINHALFRQGPNQYFFTVDARTIDHVDVVRGGASVALGADAVAGAVWVHPTDPRVDPSREGLHISPRAALRHRTSDDERGGRLQVDAQIGRHTGVLAGAGYRTVGKLEAAGPIEPLLTAEEVGIPLSQKAVPTFAEDGRTQLGTGFDELTLDLRAVHDLSARDRLTLAGYAYRQFDAPRTDQCPPPEANLSECLIYDEQYRTQIYGKAELAPDLAGLFRATALLGYQRQHERRTLDRTSTLGSLSGGRDDIDIWSARLDAETRPFALGESARLRVAYGVDGSYEVVESAAWTTLTRIGVTRLKSRGQYLDGSTFAQGGAFAAPHLSLGPWTVRAGARLAGAAVDVPEDPTSETRAVSQTWVTGVFDAGVSWAGWRDLEVLLNVEQGFRPPNLDDLSARQATGRGYQLENPDLTPESALTAELGARWRGPRLRLEAWAFQMWILDLMERKRAECPASDQACGAVRAAVQLQNLDEAAVVRGAEGLVGVGPFFGVEAEAKIAYAWGEGPSPALEEDRQIPLSRIPPLNGDVELRWRDRVRGVYAGAAMRWATDQTRLSLGDQADARIPFGGTPGYVVYDLTAGVRLGRQLQLNVILENLTDEPYRVHGSSVNGAGRGLIANMEVEPWAD